MAKINFQNDTTPLTPAAGYTSLFVDIADKHTKQIDDTGLVIDLTSGGGGGTVYPINEIVFGDGVTAGGITNPSLKYTPASTGGDFYVFGTDGTTQCTFDLHGSTGQATMLADALTLNFDFPTNTFSIYDNDGGANGGIYYAGATSTGLGSVTGLGIDILNDRYTLGNLTTQYLIIQPNVLFTGIGGLNQGFDLQSQLYKFGDVSTNFNGTSLTIDDTAEKYTFNKANFSINTLDYIFPNSYGATGAALIDTDGAGTLGWGTPIGSGTISGTANQVAYFTTASNVGGDNNFKYDTTNKVFQAAFASNTFQYIQLDGLSEYIHLQNRDFGGSFVGKLFLDNGSAVFNYQDLGTGELSEVELLSTSLTSHVDSGADQTGIRIVDQMVTIGMLSNGNSTVIILDDATQLITIANVPTYANDAAATGGGLTTGQLYKTTTGGITALNIVP